LRPGRLLIERVQPLLCFRADCGRHRNDASDVRGAVGLEGGGVLRRSWIGLGNC
jgi:hypothetical protein